MFCFICEYTVSYSPRAVYLLPRNTSAYHLKQRRSRSDNVSLVHVLLSSEHSSYELIVFDLAAIATLLRSLHFAAC